MIKVKDGYVKLIGTTYLGNNTHVLLSNGGNLQFSASNTASTLVLRNANNLIYAGQYSSEIADESLTDIGSLYVRNTTDNFIRRISKSLFYSIISDKFVTLDTAQTITGLKTFASSPKTSKTSLGYYLVDKTGYSYPGIFDNGSNLWIGTSAGATKHHTGSTYISAGHNGTSGNPTAYICVPNTANDNGSSYAILHSGNYSTYLDSRYYTEAEADNRFVNITGDTMTGALTVQSTVTGTLLISTIALGTSPLKVTSSTAVTNLNSDLLDGWHGVGSSGSVIRKSGYVTSSTANLESYWCKIGSFTWGSATNSDRDITLYLHSTFNNLRAIVLLRARWSSATSTSQAIWVLAGNIATSRLRLYYDPSSNSGTLELWYDCSALYGSMGVYVLSDAARNKLEGDDITLYTTNFTTVQTPTLTLYVNASYVSLLNNSATAAKLLTARTINGTSFDGSANITTATWGTARNITIGGTTKSVNGSGNYSWTLEEIGISGSYLPLIGGTMSGTINSTLVTTSYLKGNLGTTLINSTSSAGAYVMLFKGNSTNGYFTHGTYLSKYLLQYTAKTTVEAGTNSVTKSATLLDESGNTIFPGVLQASRFTSTVATGTAPFTINSSTLVTNLNSQFLNGFASTDFLRISKIANSTDINTLLDTLLYWTYSDGDSGTMTNGAFTASHAMILVKNYINNTDYRRSRIAFDASGNLKTFNDRGVSGEGGTWYTVLTSANYSSLIDASKYFTDLISNATTNLSITIGNTTKTIANLYSRYLANAYTSRLASMDVSFGDGTLRQFKATNATTTGKPMGDAHIIHLAWDNTGGYDGQIALPNNIVRHMQWRTLTAGTWSDWLTLLDNTNYTKFVLKLGTETIGSASLPIFLSSGTPTVCVASSLFSTLANSSDKLSITVAGQNRTLTIAFATTALYLRSVGNVAPLTGRTQAYGNVYSYNTTSGESSVGAPYTYTSVIGFGRGTSGTVEIAGRWTGGRGLWTRALRDTTDDWYDWDLILTQSTYTGITDTRYYTKTETDDRYVNVTGDIMTGELINTSTNAFRARSTDYGVIMRNDNSSFWILATDSGSPSGSYNSLRPFRINLSDGKVTLGNGLAVTGTIVGNNTILGTRLISTVAAGTAPLTVTSNTLVTNLNADLLDGVHASALTKTDGSSSYVTLTGGDGNTAGWRKVLEYTYGNYTIAGLVFLVSSRHQGLGILSIGMHSTNADGSTYVANIKYYGSTTNLSANPWRAFYNTTTKVFRLYWYYNDYSTCKVTVLSRLGSIPLPANGDWYTALPTDNGTEITIHYNRSSSTDTLATARTINGTSFNGSANITTTNWGTARTITIGNTSKSVNGSGNYTWTLAEIGVDTTTLSGKYVTLDTTQTITAPKLFSGGIYFGNSSTTTVMTSNNWIHNGQDGATSDDANLRFGSWYGVGWYPTVSGQTVPLGTNAMWLDARRGRLSTVGYITTSATSDRRLRISGGSTYSYIDSLDSSNTMVNNIVLYDTYITLGKLGRSPSFLSTVAIGTLPYACTSTTLNTNLNADLVDSWHGVGSSGKVLRKSGYVSSSIAGLSSYWAKVGSFTWGSTNTDRDITLYMHSAYNDLRAVVHIRARWSSATSTTKTIKILSGNIPTDRIRLYYDASAYTSTLELWYNCTGQYGVINTYVLSDTSRVGNESDIITLESGYFTTVLTPTLTEYVTASYVSLLNNVTSATKLANSVTLWGQSFNGSSNVSGNMTGVGTITATGSNEITMGSSDLPHFSINNGTYKMAFLIGSGGTNRGIYDYTNAGWMIYRDSSTNILIPTGNVGIGNTAPDAKLHVSGTVHITGNSTLGGAVYLKNSALSPSISFMPNFASTVMAYMFYNAGSTTTYTDSYLYFRLYSFTSGTTTRSSYYDNFRLPSTPADKTANNTYYILTTKNTSVSGGGSTWGSSITVTVNGTSKTLTIPDNPGDTKVTNTLDTATLFYVTGTSSNTTNTGTLLFDTGVYVTTTAGLLSAATIISRSSAYVGSHLYLRNGTSGTYADLRVNAAGTTDTVGQTYLFLGNATASGTANNALGYLRIYGNNTGYTTITCGTHNTSGYTLYLPGASGLIVYHTNDTAIGSATKGVYISAGGAATAMTYSLSATVNSGTTGNLAYYSGTNAISSYTSTVGSGINPIYMSSGVPTASIDTLGSSVNGLYMNAGTLTAMTYSLGATVNPATAAGKLAIYNSNTSIIGCGDTKGSSTKGIYLSSGVPTAMSFSLEANLIAGVANRLAYYLASNNVQPYTSTVGSNSKGIWLNAGAITEMSYSLLANVSPGTSGLAYYSALNTISPNTSTIGSLTTPVYLSSGTITECEGVVIKLYAHYQVACQASGSTYSRIAGNFSPIASVSRSSVGRIKINLASGMSWTGWVVSVCGLYRHEGWSIDNYPGIYASVYSQYTNYLWVSLQDDASVNDGTFSITFLVF